MTVLPRFEKMRDYKKLQDAGNKAGQEKLQKNNHKKGFNEITLCELESYLKEEYYETMEAFDQLWCVTNPLMVNMDDRECLKIFLENLRHEAADVRNICDMIIYRCNQKLKEIEK